MAIIIEGPNLAGKTMLCKALQRLGLHYEKVDARGHQLYPVAFSQVEDPMAAVDRWWMTDYLYSMSKKSYSKNKKKHHHQLSATAIWTLMLRAEASCSMYIQLDLAEADVERRILLRNAKPLDGTNDRSLTKEDINYMRVLYQRYKWPLKTTVHSMELHFHNIEKYAHTLFKAAIKAQDRVFQFAELCPTGTLNQGETLLIGIQRNKKKGITEIPFTDIKDVSTAGVLFWIIERAGLTPSTVTLHNVLDRQDQPYDLKLLVRLLQPKRIIALGKEAMHACEELKIPAASFAHPSYIKRFHFYEQDKWAQTFKELL